MTGLELLHKATKSDEYKLKIDNGMHGIFGETDSRRRTIKINRKLHAVKSGGHLIKNPNGTEKLIGTIAHEIMHAKHPNMHEKTVRKLSKKRVKTMSPRYKQKLYATARRGGTIAV